MATKLVNKKDIWYAFGMLTVSNIFVSVLVFSIIRMFFRERTMNYFESEGFFRIFSKYSKRHPYRASFIIRFMYMSLTYKNMICSVLHINLLQFVVPAIIQIPPCIYTGLLIGRSLKSLNDLDSYSFFSDWKLIMALLFYIIMFAFTIVMMVLIAKWVKEGWNQDENQEEDFQDIEDPKNVVDVDRLERGQYLSSNKEIPLTEINSQAFQKLN